MPDYDDIEYLDDDLLDDEYYDDSLNIPHLSLSGKSSSPNKKRNENDDDKKNKDDKENDDDKKNKDDKENNDDKKDKDDKENNDNNINSNKKDNQINPNLNNRVPNNLPGKHPSQNINGGNNDNLDFNRFRKNSPNVVSSSNSDNDGKKSKNESSSSDKKDNSNKDNGIKNKLLNRKGDSENDKSSSKKSPLSNLLKNKTSSDSNADDSSEGAQLVSGAVKGTLKIFIKYAPFLSFPIFLFFFIFVVMTTIVAATSNDSDDQINSISSSVGSSSYQAEFEDGENSEFIQNLRDISNEYSSNGKSVNSSLVTSVFLTIISENDDYVFNDFTKWQIITVVDAMFVDNVYNEAQFRTNLVTIFKSYFPSYSDSQIDELVNDVFETYGSYKENYAQNVSNSAVCAASGSCSYQIDGITNGNKNFAKNINISNLKVRLMQGGSWKTGSCGGTWGLEIPNEELVDFEKYVLGVAYAESGGNSYEALKAQVIAARSYSLGRIDFVGSSNGRKLYQENGQWILQITNCVSDQVYCDPDKGCSKDVKPGNQWGNVYSGMNNPITYKPPLPENSPLRQAAMEVAGEVLVDSKGYIVYTSFTNSNQTRWNSMANNGSDYKQILLSDYSGLGASNIKKMVCNTDGAGCNEATGDYATWLQAGQSWSSIHLGTSSLTIGSSGCLVTSISMLIARSGVPTNIEGEFNPGTFVEMLNTVGGFDAGGNFNWTSVSKVAPNFQYVSRIPVSGKTREEKLDSIKSLLDQGYYVVIEVMGTTGQHWVAVDTVKDGHVYMWDPATKYTDAWSAYDSNNTSSIVYFSAKR